MGRPKGPPTSTKSIRLPTAEWERLEIEAKAAGLNLNGHVARLLGCGQMKEAEPQPQQKAKPKPKAPPPERNSAPESSRGIVAGISLPLGQTRPPTPKTGRK